MNLCKGRGGGVWREVHPSQDSPAPSGQVPSVPTELTLLEPPSSVPNWVTVWIWIPFCYPLPAFLSFCNKHLSLDVSLLFSFIIYLGVSVLGFCSESRHGWCKLNSGDLGGKSSVICEFWTHLSLLKID